MDETTIVRTLRMRDLPSKVGYRPSTIYALIAKGKFPKPYKLTPGGRASGWLETTIDNWILERANTRDDKHIGSA
jgi:prophage regulatory protein